VLSREGGQRVCDLLDVGIGLFRVRPRILVLPISTHWDGSLGGDRAGVDFRRGVLQIGPGKNLRDLRFTRRQSGVLGGSITDEEILVRYTWVPTGAHVKIHIRPSQILVMRDDE